MNLAALSGFYSLEEDGDQEGQHGAVRMQRRIHAVHGLLRTMPPLQRVA